MENSTLEKNVWDSVYWFSRMLINSDRYGGIGADSRVLQNLASSINALLENGDLKQETDAIKLDILSKTIENVLLENRRKETAKYAALLNLLDDLKIQLESIEDYKVLAFTCEKILIPINDALKQIPNDDSAFVGSVAKALLDSKGIPGLANIINILDEVGVKGCLAAERNEIVSKFAILREQVKGFLDTNEQNIVLTAFCQEFERRVAQKRKGRAGRGVESITSIILNYFGIKAVHEPEHFTTGLEVDRWIKTKDGWFIGISCKRTLRERWKQAYTTDLNLLNRHKIRELWHVITFDKDLSDDKITEMGSYRAILYLPDSSEKLKHALKHPGMKNYVRPMTQFVSDLKNIT